MAFTKRAELADGRYLSVRKVQEDLMPNRSVLLVTVVVTFALILAVPRVAAEDPSQRSIAIHWSPFLYQASQNLYDVPTNFDFDGDWDGFNNWENAFAFGTFAARVYYTYQETNTHYILTYLVFHPRDYKLIGGHENDMEGARVTARKDGSPYGALQRLETFAHGGHYDTSQPEIINGSHPAIYIEAKGHGIYPDNTRGTFPNSCGGMGIWYAGRGAEYPSNCDDRDVSMDLIPFQDTLWGLRHSSPPYGGSRRFVNNGQHGWAYPGDNGCKAKAPWAWEFSSDGRWFMDPIGYWRDRGSDFGSSYVVNPYLDSTSGGAPYPCS